MKPVLLAMTLLLGAPAFAEGLETHVTADGVETPMPEIDGLSCIDMVSVLDGIDASGYRAFSPSPLNATDWPLYDYEMRLSERLYDRCTLVEPIIDDPDSPFARGFSSE